MTGEADRMNLGVDYIVLIATISFAQKYLHYVFMIPVASPALWQNTRLPSTLCKVKDIPY